MPATSFTSGEWSDRLHSLRRWLSRQRLCLTALSCCSAVLFADDWSLIAAAFWILFLIIAWTDVRKFYLLCLALSLLCGGLHRYRVTEHFTQLTEITNASLSTFEVKITNIPKQRAQSWEAQARVLTGEISALNGKKIALSGSGAAPASGAFLLVHGRIEAAEGPRNWGQFDQADWLRRNGNIGICFAQEVSNAGRSDDALMRWIFHLRQKFRNAITQGLTPGSDEFKVILAMVIGEQPPYQDGLILPFRNSGTLHLFSVSGQHVNLVALLLWLGLRIARVPRKWAIALLIPAIFCYALVTGASPPAMRAAWMASVFLAAFLFQRKPHLMNALAIVIIAALLLQSNLIFLAGVQLSYGVVAAISIGLALSQNFIKNLSYHDSYLPRELYTRKQEFIGNSWEKLLQSLGISLAACLGSAPLTIKHFGMITPISIVSNLFLSPLVFVLLGLAMLSTFLSVLSPTASSWCNQLNAQVARACIGTSALFAAIPGSHQNLSWHRIKNDSIHIHDLSRGGGAALVQTRNSDVLLDTGNERNFRNIVLPSLRYFGCEPDTIFLSHPESHHIGGATIATDHLRLRQMISPVSQSRAVSFRSLYAKAIRSKLPLYQAREGVVIRQSHDVSWTIIHAPDPQDRYAIADDRVAIYLLTFHGYRILFLNDAGPSAWDALLESYDSLRCDVIVCGRHQLHPLMAEEILDLCQPRVIISTHADFPAEEKIPSFWPEQLEQRNIILFDQGQTGMMRLEYRSSGQLVFQSFLGHHEFTLDQTSARD